MLDLFRNFISYITSPLYNLISSPTWFFSAPGKVLGLSVPHRVGIFTGLSLLLIVSVVGYLQLYHRELFGGGGVLIIWEKPFFYWALIAVLILAFSIVTGLATYYWLMELPSAYEEIDRAWKRGVTELQVAGIELSEFPLFLVMGVPDTASALAMMQASGMNLITKPAESDLQPLLWFSGEHDGDVAIFLFLLTCCQSSVIAGGRGLEKSKAVTGGPVAKSGGYHTIDDDDDAEGRRPQQAASFRQEQKPSQHSDALNSGDDFGSEDGRGGYSIAQNDDVARDRLSQPAGQDAQKLSESKAAETNRQLNHVCRKLVNARQPLSPCNGVICTVPFSMLISTKDGLQGKYLGAATRADMTILVGNLGVRPHVLAVVHGLEADDDFRVFVKRMREFEPDKLKSRFGKGVSPWVRCSRQFIEEICESACNAFQVQIYKFLSSTVSLKRIDNGHLYRFLTKVRSRAEANLTNWVVDAFTPDESQNGEVVFESRPQFAGCYFVSAQPLTPDIDPEERLFAHVPGVFEKLIELEGEVEWTEPALRRDAAYRNAANYFFLITLTGLAFIAFVVFRLVQSHE